jgi:hypothetical protein
MLNDATKQNTVHNAGSHQQLNQFSKYIHYVIMALKSPKAPKTQ